MDPMSRQSIARLAGNDNDLLADEDQVFSQLDRRNLDEAKDMEVRELLDEGLVNEIQDYL